MLLSAGNDNERAYLLPLLDLLAQNGIHPQELLADRGYHAKALEQQLLERGITPRISKPRRPGEPIPEGARVREVWRGKQRRLKVSDPTAPQRWPIERTNAWLKARRRIATRRERNPDTYLAFLKLGIVLILARSF